MLRWFVLLLGVVCCLGCNESNSSDVRDGGSQLAADGAVPADMLASDFESTLDISTVDSVVITARDARTVDSGPAHDVNLPTADMFVQSLTDLAVTDSQSTELSDASEALPMRDSSGQCALNDDCPASATGAGSCSRALPGGACLGCAEDDQCPGSSECSNFGACVTPCQMDQECSAGLTCLRSGRCAAQSCVAGACPDPRFSCSDSNQCARTVCTDDQDCHLSMFCLDSLCVQPSWQ